MARARTILSLLDRTRLIRDKGFRGDSLTSGDHLGMDGGAAEASR